MRHHPSGMFYVSRFVLSLLMSFMLDLPHHLPCNIIPYKSKNPIFPLSLSLVLNTSTSSIQGTARTGSQSYPTCASQWQPPNCVACIVPLSTAISTFPCSHRVLKVGLCPCWSDSTPKPVRVSERLTIFSASLKTYLFALPSVTLRNIIGWIASFGQQTQRQLVYILSFFLSYSALICICEVTLCVLCLCGIVNIDNINYYITCLHSD